MLLSSVKTSEDDSIRSRILNSILSTPHKKLADLAPLHAKAASEDALFYGHFAVWYFDNGEVRDHKVLFVAHLFTSAYADFRSAAFVLLQRLAPFEVARVLDYCKATLHTCPRSLKTAIGHYLSEREAEVKRFDSAAIRARDDLKHLYASLRLKPGARAQASLFSDTPPTDSPLYVLKHLHELETDAEKAVAIIDAKIPFPVAVGAIKAMSPVLLVALINAMSPQEMINSMAMLEKAGATKDPSTKKLIDAKLKLAESDGRVSTLKGKRAIANLGTAAGQSISDMMDARIAAKGYTINVPTAIFCDKSGSMEAAIEVARQIATLASAIAKAPLYVYAFDSGAFRITPATAPGKIPTESDWTRAFAPVKADGTTRISAPLSLMQRMGEVVEQIVLVTDEGENQSPTFAKAWQEYAVWSGQSPRVLTVQVGGQSEDFHRSLLAAGIDVTRVKFTGDYYALPNLLPLLAAGSNAELVAAIMAVALPVRPA